MKRIALLAGAALPLLTAFTSETCETVTVKGKDGHPLRINKSDFDADQADDGAKQYTLHKDDDGPAKAASGEPVQTFEQLGIPPVAAPSAPDFSGGQSAPIPIDPNKQAAAPVAPTPSQLLVMKSGSKYIVTDATGTPVKDRPGIENEGYKTEALALAAVAAAPQVPSPPVA